MPAPLHERLLVTADRYIGKRTNIKPAIQELREKPEPLIQLIEECDLAIGSLNNFLKKPVGLTQGAAILVPQTKRLWDILGNQPLPRISEKDPTNEQKRQSRKAFQNANHFMENGEEGMLGWEFHINPTDPTELAASMILELWAESVTVKFPKLRNLQSVFVASLEEMLAVHYQNTLLFDHVKDWFTAEDGFSQVLIDMLKGIVNPRIPQDGPIRETPNFIILGGEKPGQFGLKRFFIEPKNMTAVAKLGEAAIAHRIHTFEFPNGKMRLRADRSAHNLRVLLGGYVDVPTDGKDSIPSPDKMEECIQEDKSYVLK